MNKYVIVIPSFNDWDCLDLLIPKIDECLKGQNVEISILIVNDASTIKNNLSFKNISFLKKIEVINLKNNVKAQIAIATGLSYLKKEKFEGGIIVMDGDGQDNPKYILDIIKETQKNPNKTIVLNRTKREDELLFLIFYQIYLLISFFMTFKYLKYGVYTYLHSSSLDKAFSTKDIYLAYPASLAKHFKDKSIIYTQRKKRILGNSKNSYIALTYYALKIIAVFKKQVLINSSAFIFLSFLFSGLKIFSFIFLSVTLFLIVFNILIFSIANRVDKLYKNENISSNIESIEKLI